MVKFIKKTWFFPLLLVIGITFTSIFFVDDLFLKNEPLSQEAISEQIERMYAGTVDNINVKKDIFVVEMNRKGAVYQVEVDGVSGNILSLEQLSEVIVKSQEVLSEEKLIEIIAKDYQNEIERMVLNNEAETPVYEVEVVKDQTLVKVIVDAISGEIISANSQGATDPHALISREHAVTIAFTQLKGDVEYIEFKQTKDGGFYLIEIEQNNDNGKNLEAVIQIHAITGEILSVVWDD